MNIKKLVQLESQIEDKGKYKCNLCKDVFQSETLLSYHDKYTCKKNDIVEVKFNKDIHKKFKIPTTKPEECTLDKLCLRCFEGFDCVRDLTKHMKKPCKEFKISCQLNEDSEENEIWLMFLRMAFDGNFSFGQSCDNTNRNILRKFYKKKKLKEINLGEILNARLI